MLIIISSLVIGSEVALYTEWGSKLNFTALSHLKNPSEVFLSASFYHTSILLFFLLIGVLFTKIFNQYLELRELFSFHTSNNLNKFFESTLHLIFIGFMFMLVRGGLQPIPINLSDSYFSKHMILNDISVNPSWNIFQSFLKSKTNLKGNPYEKYNNEEINVFAKSLSNDIRFSGNILNIEKPNIVFVLLESWSADNIESLGGLKGITPNFKKLEKEGYLFDNFYTNGWTSDQAMSSIFSSFPVFPYVAVINQSDKSRRLSSLNNSLPDDYHSSFFFGGQLTYGNIKGYFISKGFDIVKDEEDYPNLEKGGLGVHDGDMFQQFKQELNTLPQPFMSTLFTLSSHSPYDFPGERNLSFNSKEDTYVNSVAYTDKCLGNFISSIKNEEWYKNTLFIIVADHSHNSPKGWKLAQKERFKIPMIWYGNVIKEEFKGKIHKKLGSQLDIVPTLLRQLNLDANEYKFGKDLFNINSVEFVPYAFPRGYGWIRPEGYYAFSQSYNRVLEHEANSHEEKSKIKKEAELFFQLSFQDYMDL
ncbi:MAG: LTA synthase family protein [Bacteroidota bacterium]|nr:LTA synthase family protein [Bacteroidota bacterium]